MRKLLRKIKELGYITKPKNTKGVNKFRVHSISVHGCPIDLFVLKHYEKGNNFIYFGWMLDSSTICAVECLKLHESQDFGIIESIACEKIDMWINKSVYDISKFKSKTLSSSQLYVTLSELFFSRKDITTWDLVKVRDYLKTSAHKSTNITKNKAIYHLYTVCHNMSIQTSMKVFKYLMNIYIKDRNYKWKYITPELKRLQEAVRREYEKYRSTEQESSKKNIYKIPISTVEELVRNPYIGDMFEADGLSFKIKTIKDGFAYVEEIAPLVDIHALRGEGKPTILGFAEKDNRKAIRVVVENLLKRYYGYIPYYIIKRNAFAMKIELRTGEYIMLNTKVVAQYANNLLWDY
jgi:hypothetical protein